jgi:peroxiredoxin Q/BCP
MATNNTLRIGDQAPDFTLPATIDQSVHLYAVLERSSVVLFFYLKAFTPVCTAETCAFRDNLEAFKEHNSAVYGISSDSISNAERFAKRNHILFPLLSDANGDVRKRYNVPKAFGLLPGRSTYFIGQDRRIKGLVHAQLNAKLHVVETLHFIDGEAP